MPVKILMPALSPTMTEGKLAKWLVKEGDEVSSGDVIAEIETDKATMEVEAVEEGRVGKIVVPEGAEGVKVNETIALLLGEDEDEAALDQAAAASKEPPKSPPKHKEAETRAETVQAEAARTGKRPPAQEAGETPKAAGVPAASADTGADRVFASPLARRMAQQAGLDLSSVNGTGPRGRIVKHDVEAAMGKTARAPQAPVPVAAQAAPIAPTTAEKLPFEPDFEVQPASSMRKVIASRLSESKRTIPHFYLSVDCEIDALLAMRKQLNERADDKYKLSVNDMVVKAVGVALRRVPAANVSWTDEGIKLYKSADVSVAVAIEGGLITPVVRGADGKGLETISNEMKALAAKAREGKLQPEEYQGGTFSISNLGMYGIKDFYAVINPPQACILAVGAGEQRPVVKDGALAVATVMTCSLAVDHRAVDGAVGAQFLTAFKALIEDPLTMLL